MKILNFGSLNLDHIYRTPHFVKPGETLSAVQSLAFGGKGLNQSVALARAGATVCHAGCIGAGGEVLTEFLSGNGVDVSNVMCVSVPQGNAVIEVTDSGENRIILSGGSNEAVTEAHISKVLSEFDSGDVIVLQNEINNIPLIVDTAYSRGLSIVMNPSPFNDKLKAVDFNKISWLIMNEIEAEQFTGEREYSKAVEYIKTHYPDMQAVITLGVDGSVCYSGGNTVFQPAIPAKAVDTTAAGDTFTGYFLHLLTRGKPIAECMRAAAAAASVCVSRSGASPSIPYISEIAI